MLKLKLHYFAHLMLKNDSDAGKDWMQKKGMMEDEMVRWYHGHDGHEFEQAPGIGDGQGSLVCCNPWDRKESDTSERRNWPTETITTMLIGYTPIQNKKLKKRPQNPEWSNLSPMSLNGDNT